MACCNGKYSASALKHQVVIETLTMTPNDSGGQDTSWATFASVWASITPKPAREALFAQRLEDRTSHLVVVRYLSGVQAKMRVKFGTRYLQIKSVVNVEEDNSWLELHCEEGTGT